MLNEYKSVCPSNLESEQYTEIKIHITAKLNLTTLHNEYCPSSSCEF